MMTMVALRLEARPVEAVILPGLRPARYETEEALSRLGTYEVVGRRDGWEAAPVAWRPAGDPRLWRIYEVPPTAPGEVRDVQERWYAVLHVPTAALRWLLAWRDPDSHEGSWFLSEVRHPDGPPAPGVPRRVATYPIPYGVMDAVLAAVAEDARRRLATLPGTVQLP